MKYFREISCGVTYYTLFKTILNSILLIHNYHACSCMSTLENILLKMYLSCYRTIQNELERVMKNG